MKRNATVGWALLTFAVLVLAWQSAPAETTATPVNRPVVFGGDANYPPYHFVEMDGQPEGFDVELFKSIANTAGFQVRFDLGDWGETLDKLERGEVDVVPMFYSESRRKRFDFSHSFLARYHLIFARRGAAFVHNLGALSGREVILQRAGYALDTLAEMEIRISPILTETEPGAVRLLAAGAHEYAVVPEFTGRYAIRQYDLQNIVISGPPVMHQDYAFAVTRGNHALVEEINRALETLSSSGEFNALYSKWLANLEPPHEIESALRQKFLVLVLPLLLLIGLLAWLSRRFWRQRLAEFGKRREAEKQARYLAYHDSLTGLPNRNRFAQDLSRQLTDAESAGRRVALIMVRMVNLQQINQFAGYAVGDQVLKSTGNLLRKLYTTSVSTFSPGNFVVSLGHLAGQDDVQEQTRQFIDVIERPKVVDGVSIVPRCRAGIAIFPDNAQDADELVRKAELAQNVSIDLDRTLTMYLDKYQPDARNLRLLSDLKSGLEQSQFALYVQPKLGLSGGEICGGEILVRWNHPELGLLMPNTFVPLAEKSGFIREITLYLLQQTIAYIDHLPAGTGNLQFSVNVSARDFSDTEFAGKVKTIAGSAARRLILELTETAAMHDSRDILAASRELQEAGIALSIDDFGTGYSSLSYLRQLSPAELKIDRMFVKDLREHRDDEIVVRSTIDLAHELGLKVVAEGVEDPETLELLQRMGCDMAQGYGISRPMPLEALVDWRNTFKGVGSSGSG